MGSESRLCGWHLPPIEAPKVKETRQKITNTQRGVMNPVKYKTKPSETDKFHHLTDAARYIDEYRIGKSHTVASAATEWGEGFESLQQTSEDAKFPKYIDIRVPEKKICLTGLPQLRPPAKHVIRTRAIHEKFGGSPFLAGVPHLPHLTLSGAPKTVVTRKTNRTDGQKHKKTHRKKKQGRFPYLEPSVEPGRTIK